HETPASHTDPFPLRMIELFEAEQNDIAVKEKPLHVNYQLHEKRHNYSQDYYYQISLKVGETQLYIVKDLSAFIKAIESKQNHPITERFSYKPKEHFIDQQDLELLSLIKEAINH